MTSRYTTTKACTCSSGTPGRAICSARSHHFVSDDTGGEALNPGELFLAGISSCAVNLVERSARQDKIPLQWMDVSVEAVRDHESVPQPFTVYDDVKVHFQMWGIEEALAQSLVEVWEQR